MDAFDLTVWTKKRSQEVTAEAAQGLSQEDGNRTCSP